MTAPLRGRYKARRIVAWDFDRIVISHGRIVERGGRDVLRRAYAFVLDAA